MFITKISPALWLCGLSILAGTSTAAERSSADPTDIFTPPRIAYQDLLNLDDTTRKKLSSIVQNIGLFSITSIPMMAREKPETLQSLPACIDALLRFDDNRPAANTAKTHTFADGTIRKTMATSSGDLDNNDDSFFNRAMTTENFECWDFQESSGAFRQTVAEVTRTVGHALSSLLGETRSLLKDKNGVKSYDSLEEIVTHGEHLEHFHVYSKPPPKENGNHTTIDWHTDQGLFLLFSPGTMVQNNDNIAMPRRHDFYIQLANGNAVAVDFDLHRDELVVMLGDGMNHPYITHPGMTHHNKKAVFRPVPHALHISMAPTTAARVWYGLMVLPPRTAVHPVHQQTFGELRDSLIRDGQGLGCYSSTTGATSKYRQLQDITADMCSPDNQAYCWHRCLNFTETVSTEACAALESDSDDAPFEVACVHTETRELWGGDEHNPAFVLGCHNGNTAAGMPDSLAVNGNHTEEEELHDDPEDDTPTGDSTNSVSSAPRNSLIFYMSAIIAGLSFEFLYSVSFFIGKATF